MSTSCVTLAEHPTEMVRPACTKCERRGQYWKAALIERYGPDKNMVDQRRPRGVIQRKAVAAGGAAEARGH